MTFAAPIRLSSRLRPSASPGLLFGSAATSTIFVATSFAVPAVIDDYRVSAGAAVLISTAQVGGFTLTNLVGGRRLVPSADMARGALGVMVVTNLVSVFAPNFALLVMLRFLCGLAMGLFTWIAWADSADDDTRRGSIAAVGPLTSAVAAPLLAVAVNVGGLDAIYGTLAVVSVLCMLLPITVEAAISHGRRPIEAKGILPVLLGMAGLTLGGSAVFVFIGVIARDQIGMSTVTLSIALSLNAVAGIPTARYAGRRRFPGVFIMLTGCCAFLLTVADSTVMFMAIVTIWGMTFWLAVPETYALLSERSRHPADRIGDAQAIMSMGRVIGPTVGGALVAAGSFTVLGLVAGGVMIAGGLAVTYVSMSHRWDGAAAVDRT
ncbi:MAG: MFS transporter [Acidimicrobiales bacterium]